MRVVIVALAVLAVILAVVFVKMWLWPAVPNPEEARLSFNLKGLVYLYVDVLRLLKDGNYDEALRVLGALGSSSGFFSSPDVRRLHVSEENLTQLLAELDALQRLISVRLQSGDAEGAVRLASLGIVKASLADRSASEILGLVARLSPELVANATRYVEAIRAKITQLNSTFVELVEGPVSTNITLYVEPAAVPVGGRVVAYGVVSMENGTAVSNGTVAIYVEGAEVGRVAVGAGGRYAASFSMPYIYRDVVEVAAVYTPPSGSRLLPSRASTRVEVLYNATELHVDFPGSVVWGEALYIWGKVSGPGGRVVSFKVGRITGSVVSGADGRFEVVVDTRLLSPGLQAVSIAVPPNGSYGPAGFNGAVEVQAFDAGVAAWGPRLAVAGLPVEVRGTVERWVAGMPVSISLGGASVSLVLEGPNFTALLPTSLLTPSGPHRLVVSVGSVPPVRGGEAFLEVFILNPLQVAVPASVAASAVIFFKRRPAGVTGVEARPVPVIPALEAAPSGLALPAASKLELREVREVLSALSTALSAVAGKTGRAIGRSETLREYLNAVRSSLDNEKYELLRELVELGERALYSPVVPTSVDIARAWELASRIAR